MKQVVILNFHVKSFIKLKVIIKVQLTFLITERDKNEKIMCKFGGNFLDGGVDSTVWCYIGNSIKKKKKNGAGRLWKMLLIFKST